MKKLIKSIIALALLSVSVLSCASGPKKGSRNYITEPEFWEMPAEVNGFSTEGYSEDQIKAWQFFADRMVYFDYAVKNEGLNLSVLDGLENFTGKDGKLGNDYYELFCKLQPYMDKAYWHSEEHYYNKMLYPQFENIYGSKEELLKKGYVVNETMFYYPAHDGKWWDGENDWRVGYWAKYDKEKTYSFQEVNTRTMFYTENQNQFYAPDVYYWYPFNHSTQKLCDFTKTFNVEKAKKAKVIIIARNDLYDFNREDNWGTRCGKDSGPVDYKAFSKIFEELNEDAKAKGEKKVIIYSQNYHRESGWNLACTHYFKYHIVDDTVPYEEQTYAENEYLEVIRMGCNSRSDARYDVDATYGKTIYKCVDGSWFWFYDKKYREVDYDKDWVEGKGFMADIWLSNDNRYDMAIIIDHYCEQAIGESYIKIRDREFNEFKSQNNYKGGLYDPKPKQ